MLYDPEHRKATREECALALKGQKGKAFMEACDRIDNGEERFKTKFQVKYDETVKSASIPGQPVRVKPRSVKNVDTTVQTKVLPVARFIAKTIKTTYDGEHSWQVGRYEVRFVVATVTKEKLDFYSRLHRDDDALVVIVSCDDTSVSFGRYASEFGSVAMESDYSSYDQSQAQEFFQGDSVILDPVMPLELFGGWWAYHFAINSMPMKATMSVPKDLDTDPTLLTRLDVLSRPNMRTGIGTTSDLGSLHNIQAHTCWLLARTSVISYLLMNLALNWG